MIATMNLFLENSLTFKAFSVSRGALPGGKRIEIPIQFLRKALELVLRG